ncbi:Hypothetical protein, putative [Bodo saltans]|uniref:Uncharacterized protein n=1 Tax=Bodo saltans TaxID=75058 RepID=A0A0S4JGN5_BODSA|nr:Hypothetical protein, putative [Bodo saltans]|eukprot:CUG89276.1 Hypothetical protein, putative [Bodo saltans]
MDNLLDVNLARPHSPPLLLFSHATRSHGSVSAGVHHQNVSRNVTNVVLSSSASRDVPVETAYDRFCLRVLRGSSVVCLVTKAKLPTLTEPLLKSRYVAPPLSPVCTLRDLIEPHTAE